MEVSKACKPNGGVGLLAYLYARTFLAIATFLHPTEHRTMMAYYRDSQNLTARLRQIRGAIFATAVACLNGACALVPGDKAYSLRGQESAVKLPVRQGEQVVPENVRIRPITADLIIEQFQSSRARQNGNLDIVSDNKTDKRVLAPVGQIEYRVGPGDILTIVVWDHPELTTPAGQYRSADQAGTVVSEDGSIFYPYIGSVQVAGKTTRQIRDILASKLARYIERVQLDVRIAAFRSKRVYVVGEVNRPGLQEITDIPMTVLEAVNRAGGFSLEADHSRVLLTRKGVTYQVNIQSMYEEGAVEQNALLEPGDILNVSDRSFNKIFVLGEVAKPGSMLMTKKRSSLAEALSDSGYIAQDKANPKWIYVMRGESESPELFHLDGSSPDSLLLADKFSLRPRDIVYVDAADVVRWNRVIVNILPTAQTLFQLSNTRYPIFNGRQ